MSRRKHILLLRQYKSELLIMSAKLRTYIKLLQSHPDAPPDAIEDLLKRFDTMDYIQMGIDDIIESLEEQLNLFETRVEGEGRKNLR